jgi:hypothetical protein
MILTTTHSVDPATATETMTTADANARQIAVAMIIPPEMGETADGRVIDTATGIGIARSTVDEDEAVIAT